MSKLNIFGFLIVSLFLISFGFALDKCVMNANNSLNKGCYIPLSNENIGEYKWETHNLTLNIDNLNDFKFYLQDDLKSIYYPSLDEISAKMSNFSVKYNSPYNIVEIYPFCYSYPISVASLSKYKISCSTTNTLRFCDLSTGENVLGHPDEDIKGTLNTTTKTVSFKDFVFNYDTYNKIYKQCASSKDWDWNKNYLYYLSFPNKCEGYDLTLNSTYNYKCNGNDNSLDICDIKTGIKYNDLKGDPFTSNGVLKLAFYSSEFVNGPLVLTTTQYTSALNKCNWNKNYLNTKCDGYNSFWIFDYKYKCGPNNTLSFCHANSGLVYNNFVGSKDSSTNTIIFKNSLSSTNVFSATVDKYLEYYSKCGWTKNLVCEGYDFKLNSGFNYKCNGKDNSFDICNIKTDKEKKDLSISVNKTLIDSQESNELRYYVDDSYNTLTIDQYKSMHSNCNWNVNYSYPKYEECKSYGLIWNDVYRYKCGTNNMLSFCNLKTGVKNDNLFGYLENGKVNFKIMKTSSTLFSLDKTKYIYNYTQCGWTQNIFNNEFTKPCTLDGTNVGECYIEITADYIASVKNPMTYSWAKKNIEISAIDGLNIYVGDNQINIFNDGVLELTDFYLYWKGLEGESTKINVLPKVPKTTTTNKTTTKTIDYSNCVAKKIILKGPGKITSNIYCLNDSTCKINPETELSSFLTNILNLVTTVNTKVIEGHSGSICFSEDYKDKILEKYPIIFDDEAQIFEQAKDGMFKLKKEEASEPVEEISEPTKEEVLKESEKNIQYVPHEIKSYNGITPALFRADDYTNKYYSLVNELNLNEYSLNSQTAGIGFNNTKKKEIWYRMPDWKCDDFRNRDEYRYKTNDDLPKELGTIEHPYDIRFYYTSCGQVKDNVKEIRKLLFEALDKVNITEIDVYDFGTYFYVKTTSDNVLYKLLPKELQNKELLLIMDEDMFVSDLYYYVIRDVITEDNIPNVSEEEIKKEVQMKSVNCEANNTDLKYINFDYENPNCSALDSNGHFCDAEQLYTYLKNKNKSIKTDLDSIVGKNFNKFENDFNLNNKYYYTLNDVPVLINTGINPDYIISEQNNFIDNKLIGLDLVLVKDGACSSIGTYNSKIDKCFVSKDNFNDIVNGVDNYMPYYMVNLKSSKFAEYLLLTSINIDPSEYGYEYVLLKPGNYNLQNFGGKSISVNEYEGLLDGKVIPVIIKYEFNDKKLEFTPYSIYDEISKLPNLSSLAYFSLNPESRNLLVNKNLRLGYNNADLVLINSENKGQKLNIVLEGKDYKFEKVNSGFKLTLPFDTNIDRFALKTILPTKGNSLCYITDKDNTTILKVKEIIAETKKSESDELIPILERTKEIVKTTVLNVNNNKELINNHKFANDLLNKLLNKDVSYSKDNSILNGYNLLNEENKYLQLSALNSKNRIKARLYLGMNIFNCNDVLETPLPNSSLKTGKDLFGNSASCVNCQYFWIKSEDTICKYSSQNKKETLDLTQTLDILNNWNTEEEALDKKQFMKSLGVEVEEDVSVVEDIKDVNSEVKEDDVVSTTSVEQPTTPIVKDDSTASAKCDDETDCSSDQYCTIKGCVAKKQNNSSCLLSKECLSNYCLAGQCLTKPETVDVALGTVPIGDKCSDNKQCVSNAFCQNQGSQTICVSKLSTGTRCLYDYQCLNGDCLVYKECN